MRHRRAGRGQTVSTINDPAEVAGPAGDGSQHLARESKWGQTVTFVVTGIALVLADAANAIDLSGVPDYLVPVATVALGTAAGTLTAWATRNRTGLTARRVR